MPIGGASGIGWDETVPPVTESAGLGAQRIQSLKTSVRQVIAAEHTMDASGGNAQGAHAPGSCRPFYGTQSAVSSSGSDARTMVTSDTSRFFGVGSAGTVLLGGGPTALSLGTFPGTTPQRHYWVEEVGMSNFTSALATPVTLPNSGYSGLPYIWLTSVVTGGVGSVGAVLSVTELSSTAFTAFVSGPLAISAYSGQVFFWRSLGTRCL